MPPRDRKPKNNARRFSSRSAEMKASRLHEDLAEFEEFRETTLKAIRKDIAKGMKAKDLREKYAAIVQGRLLTDALTMPDEAKAAIIGKDIIDRVEGKATEKKEVTHKFKDMTDQELDAVLKSEEDELKEMEGRFQQ